MTTYTKGYGTYIVCPHCHAEIPIGDRCDICGKEIKLEKYIKIKR